jgi:hypothetical protein
MCGGVLVGGAMNVSLCVQVPPPGALAEFGFLFRIVLGLVSIPLTAAVRYLVVGATCMVCRWLQLPGWTPSIKEE